MEISFHFQKTATLEQRKKLKLFITSIFKSEKKTVSNLSFVFCSDAYLLEINRNFLQHNFFTDIITFDLSQKNQKEIVGEIYISVDRVRENAITFQTKIQQELQRVMFHGVLHLIGYADKSKPQKAKMTQRENLYLKKYAVST
ncbi:MAG: rRNA maturation RNase YbeY [Ferruginibacter sp.]